MGMESDYRWDERYNMLKDKSRRNFTGVRQVMAPSYDWSVIYVNDIKVWEGHDCENQPVRLTVEALGGTYKVYEYTDENEIDGCTPDKFSDIIGIKDL